jgi:hypothetical protein
MNNFGDGISGGGPAGEGPATVGGPSRQRLIANVFGEALLPSACRFDRGSRQAPEQRVKFGSQVNPVAFSTNSAFHFQR